MIHITMVHCTTTLAVRAVTPPNVPRRILVRHFWVAFHSVSCVTQPTRNQKRKIMVLIFLRLPFSGYSFYVFFRIRAFFPPLPPVFGNSFRCQVRESCGGVGICFAPVTLTTTASSFGRGRSPSCTPPFLIYSLTTIFSYHYVPSIIRTVCTVPPPLSHHTHVRIPSHIANFEVPSASSNFHSFSNLIFLFPFSFFSPPVYIYLPVSMDGSTPNPQLFVTP